MPSQPPIDEAPPRDPAALRVLVAEDDPVSCRFLADGLGRYGASVTTRSHGGDALALARASRFDLLLLDCHMPGCGAESLAAALRGDADAASGAALVVAASAGFGPDGRRALLAAGCDATLDKPCTLEDLRGLLDLAALRRQPSGVLDDAAGYLSCGDGDTLRALRRLFAGELRALLAELDELAARPPALAARMHRLRAASGFCGATTLAAAAAGVEAESRRTHGARRVALDQLRIAARDTLRAMEARDLPG